MLVDDRLDPLEDLDIVGGCRELLISNFTRLRRRRLRHHVSNKTTSRSARIMATEYVCSGLAAQVEPKILCLGTEQSVVRLVLPADIAPELTGPFVRTSGQLSLIIRVVPPREGLLTAFLALPSMAAKVPR